MVSFPLKMRGGKVFFRASTGTPSYGAYAESHN